jgi:hypothetical protein
MIFFLMEKIKEDGKRKATPERVAKLTKTDNYENTNLHTIFYICKLWRS